MTPEEKQALRDSLVAWLVEFGEGEYVFEPRMMCGGFEVAWFSDFIMFPKDKLYIAPAGIQFIKDNTK